jgi:hypothetical protein
MIINPPRLGTGRGYYYRDGRKMIFFGSHNKADKDGFVEESVLIYEKATGETVKPEEVIHHRDNDKTNNNISNLQCMTDHDHRVLHATYHPKDIHHRFIKKGASCPL